MKKVFVFLAALPLLGFSSFASALTCDEIDFSADITSEYPDAKDACIEVVERDGQPYVKMKVELVRPGSSNKLTFQFKHLARSHYVTCVLGLR